MKASLRRKPKRYRDELGTVCVQMRLARGQGYARIDLETFKALEARGISTQWNLNANQDGFGKVKSYLPGKGTVTIAREALGLSKGDGLRARHRNGDVRDLRQSNLVAERRSNGCSPAPAPQEEEVKSVTHLTVPSTKQPRQSRRRPVMPWHFRDGSGRACVRVRLGHTDERAILYADDYSRLISDGLSRMWQAASNGAGVRRYVYAKHSVRGTVQVARELFDLRRGDGIRITYRNGDTFDLRRDNLESSQSGRREIKTNRQPLEAQTSP